MRILLLSPPLTDPIVPNLAIELLAELGRREGHVVDTLHCGLLQPRELSGDAVHALWAPAAFAPPYYRLPVASIMRDMLAAVDEDFGDGATSNHGLASVERSLTLSIDLAEACLQAVLEAIRPRRYDVIGFSLGCDAQKMPAAAIAKLLRMRGEPGAFVAGGTGVDGPMGAAFLERFEEFDYVLQGEAEDTWPQLVRAVAAGREPTRVAGCVYRRGREVRSNPERSPAAPPRPDIIPNYESFIAQRARSPYADSTLLLLFETSRGCWWGTHSHCAFCGIRAVNGAFRAMDPNDALSMLTSVFDRYAPDVLYAADAIAPRSYAASLWPMLAQARAGRDWKIFWEVKSAVNRRSVASMSAAGVTHIQPGIETFNSKTLRLMRKGSTAAHQISCLAIARAHDIELTYGLIVGTPGESPSDLREMAALLPRLYHLPPPSDVHELALYRFSPHFTDPSKFGIDNIRPYAIQKALYRCDTELLARLCYRFNFDVLGRRNPEHQLAVQAVIDSVELWRAIYGRGYSCVMQDLGQAVLVTRAVGGERSVETVSDETEATVLRLGVEAPTVATLASAAGREKVEVLDASARLESRGFVLRDGDRVVSLPIAAGRRFGNLGPRAN